MSIRLNRCPFCGGEASLKSKQSKLSKTFWRVVCDSCECGTYCSVDGYGYEGESGKQKAISQWNSHFKQAPSSSETEKENNCTVVDTKNLIINFIAATDSTKVNVSRFILFLDYLKSDLMEKGLFSSYKICFTGVFQEIRDVVSKNGTILSIVPNYQYPGKDDIYIRYKFDAANLAKKHQVDNVILSSIEDYITLCKAKNYL